ncbi:hypothetical protein IscW_ISCW003364 [Ixodes scapularis]|uniref:Uncharacterized protein n=1 Tax=Ixodes scapularis TaxID=6945 RepID=B7PD83_IXOSC|nr:hypothetical protein IscW_ISCW003364 [Ixodes scapularis]|eukprot:XP_002410670.1 hypothetical protein IscW_ISCW003364 [Ixodes scapularis]
MSVGDALVLAMDIAIKHGLAWTAIEDILKFGNLMLGRNVLPETKYIFRKFSGSSPEEMTFHFCCPSCETLLAKTGGKLSERNSLSCTCTICGEKYLCRQLMTNGNYFVSLPLQKQFASLLADISVREQLLKSLSRESEDTCLSDIMDGAFYKNQRKKLNCQPEDLTLTVSTDGSPMFRSSSYAIWPVHLTLNELPSHLRWNNVICSLLWYQNNTQT